MNNMKASELRIGNYYNQFENTEKVSWSTLKTLEESTTEQLWCKPIPLTEEWLLKFGFDKEYSKLTNITTFNLPNTPFSYCQGKLILTTGTGDFCVNIEHVHELQNLYFALTGEELTFKSE